MAISDEARVDIAAGSIWVTGQMAFFDVRVFNPIPKGYVDMDTLKAYPLNEKVKKKNYNKRILEVGHGSFTPIVMSAYGGVGKKITNSTIVSLNCWQKRKTNNYRQ